MLLTPNFCAALLQYCRQCGHAQTTQAHAALLKLGILSAPFFGNSMLHSYAISRQLGLVKKLFDEMSHRNSFAWNTLMEAYLQSGDSRNALQVFQSMPERNEYAWNALISGLVKAGRLDESNKKYIEMPTKSAIAANSLLHGYVSSGQYERALELYKSLGFDHCTAFCKTDGFILATVINACACLQQLDGGRQIHTCIFVNGVELDSVLGSSLLDMYGKCGDVDSASKVLDSLTVKDEYSMSALIAAYGNCGKLNDARKLFDRVKGPSVVICNSMLACFVSCNQGVEALKLLNEMRLMGVRGDSSTFTSVLRACSCLGELIFGRQIHAYSEKVGISDATIFASVLVDMYAKCGGVEDACKLFGQLREHDTVLLNSMITAYSSCGRIEDARRIFDMIPARTLISWNSMMVAYGQNGHATESLKLFIEMRRSGLVMDNITIATAVGSSASICEFNLGAQIFSFAIITGVESDHIVSTSLIDLYCKCGHISDARKVFANTRARDVAFWNCMLMGYATNGYGVETLKLFAEMRAFRMPPNDITMLAVLMGCVHGGLFEEGRSWFNAMQADHGIEPQVEHYSCMIDLLARVGRIEEAISFADNMPFGADVSIWSSILRRCQEYGDEIRGRKAAERILRLDPGNSEVYVQLCNIFSVCGDWERAVEVRHTMGSKKLKKNPGCSWVNG